MLNCRDFLISSIRCVRKRDFSAFFQCSSFQIFIQQVALLDSIAKGMASYQFEPFVFHTENLLVNEIVIRNHHPHCISNFYVTLFWIKVLPKLNRKFLTNNDTEREKYNLHIKIDQSDTITECKWVKLRLSRHESRWLNIIDQSSHVGGLAIGMLRSNSTFNDK